MVIVDRFIKIALFILYMIIATVEDIIYSLLKELIPSFGLPEIIILDKDKIFSLKLW
jgi:hypothetical protein